MYNHTHTHMCAWPCLCAMESVAALPIAVLDHWLSSSIHRIIVSSLCGSNLWTSNVLICWPSSRTCRIKTEPVSDSLAASNRTSGMDSRQALLHTINRFKVNKSMTKKGVAHLLLHHGLHSCAMRAQPQVQAMTARRRYRSAAWRDGLTGCILL